jgi:hypothetical protein
MNTNNTPAAPTTNTTTAATPAPTTIGGVAVHNATSHAINVLDAEGVTHTIPSSGVSVRVAETRTEAAPIGSFAVTEVTGAEVTGLPAPQEGTFIVVSAMVLSAAAGRSDLLGPDTGSTAVRNEKGHIVAVKGFVRRCAAL